MIIIGEKINGSRKAVAKAICNRDKSYIKELARGQYNCGAKYLDVNAGSTPDKEAADMAWLVTAVKEGAPEAVLCIDSPNPEVLKAGIEASEIKPGDPIMINSLSGDERRMEDTLSLALTYQTELILLPLDDKGVPLNAEARVELAAKLVEICRKNNISDNKLYIDALVLSQAMAPDNVTTTLKTIKLLKESFPDCHVVCGHSNVSFGMPMRSKVNQLFMALTVSSGIDCAIMDPQNKDLLAALYIAEAMMGIDRYCTRMNRAYLDGMFGEIIKNPLS